MENILHPWPPKILPDVFEAPDDLVSQQGFLILEAVPLKRIQPHGPIIQGVKHHDLPVPGGGNGFQ
jgi:hypothetical protein